MKRTLPIVFLSLFLFLNFSWSIGQIWSLDFETAGNFYTTSTPEFTDGDSDFWLRTDGTDFNSNIAYSGVLGTYYFAGMDIDGEGAALPAIITIDDIDISGETNLEFRIYLAEDDASDAAEDWDDSDYFHVNFDIDNSGTFTPLLWVENNGDQYNSAPLIDTDFDGNGDGTEITSTFVQFTTSITGTGSYLDLQLVFNLNAGDEDIAIDHLEVYGGATPTPAISVTPVSLTGFYYIEGAGPSSSHSFTVSGSNLTDDILVTPPADYEISVDDVYFQLTPLTLAESGGSVPSTTLYTRLRSGLSAGSFEENITCSTTGAMSRTIACDGIVEAPATATIPYNEPFLADLGDCYTYDVSGATKEWYWNSGGFAAVNGFDSGDTEEDWLILPGINFDIYTLEIMSFDTWYRFGNDDANNYLKLFYSTNYGGLGDPGTANWTELNFTQPSADQTWTSSGNIDLSGISGTRVYLAFKYHYESGSYRWWEVDNLSIIEAGGISNESNIVIASAWSEPQNIDYTLYSASSGLTISNAIEVARFTIQDGGDDLTDADLHSTVLADIEFQINHADNIQALAVFDGSTNIAETTSVASSTTYNGLTLAAGDEGTKDFSLYATFKTTVTDNDNLWFNITAASAEATGSGFADPDAGGADTDNTGNNNKIVVTATMLAHTAPGTVVINQDFPITFDATDVNGNIDLDDASLVTLSLFQGTGTLSSLTGLSQNMSAGSFTWSDIQYDVAELFIVYYANGYYADTININATGSVNNNLIISEVADPSVPAQAKYIELYNAGSTTIDFGAETWYVSRHSYTADCSPSDWWDYQLTGSIAPGACYIVTSHPTAFDAAYGAGLYDRVAAGMNGNGNDPYMLYKGGDHSTGVLMDIYGVDECGDDKVWEYTDGHVVRHRDILTPSDTYDPDEWTWIPCDSSAMTVKEHRTNKTWAGTSSDDWNEKGSNWDRTYIPDASDNVYIPDVASNQVHVTLPGACNFLEIENNQRVTIEPAVFLVNVDEINNLRGEEGLILKNDGSDYGSLLHNDNNVPGTIECFIAEEQWHIVSAPISDALSGVFLDLYLYYWMESDSSWHFIAPVNVPMPAGQGFYTWASNTLTGDITVAYEGLLNNGDLTVTMPYTSAATHGGQGWNLIGNPFPSPVQFDNRWSFNNVAPTIYMYDGVQYKTWNTNTGGTLDTNVVAVGNGFWMKATAAGSVTIPQTARQRHFTSFMKDEDICSQLQFSISGNGLEDKIILDFRDEATSTYDEAFDAYKLMGDVMAPQLYFMSGGEKLTVNSLPFDEKLVIPVHLQVGETGQYVFRLDEQRNVEHPVYLKDLFNGLVYQLMQGQEIIFSAHINDPADRFQLLFDPSLDIKNHITNDQLHVSIKNGLLAIESDQLFKGEVLLYNNLGMLMLRERIDGMSKTINVGNFRGYALVKLISEKENFTFPVFLH